MSTSKNIVLLAGATGLVGKQCLSILLQAPTIGSVIAVARRAIPKVDPRLDQVVTEFAALDSASPKPADVALCSLGTTRKRAGAKEAFRQVDYEAVLSFARFALRSGVKTFGLTSAIGADSRSLSFYLKVKGEAEDAVGRLGFRSVVALRPSLLLGTRDESRPGEAVSQKILPFFSPLLKGSTRRLRAIESEAVARALASLAVCVPPAENHIWYYDEIVRAASATAMQFDS